VWRGFVARFSFGNQIGDLFEQAEGGGGDYGSGECEEGVGEYEREGRQIILLVMNFEINNKCFVINTLERATRTACGSC